MDLAYICAWACADGGGGAQDDVLAVGGDMDAYAVDGGIIGNRVQLSVLGA